VGSTGSIGTQAAEVVAAEPGRYQVVALAANRSVEALAAQARTLGPSHVALADPAGEGRLRALVPAGTEVWAGPGALEAVAELAEVVVNGVVGFAGLGVTLAALGAGRRLALANKESLVAGGPVVARVRAGSGGEIVPVDSEHAALHQCLRSGRPEEVAELVLTASGGPFRGSSAAELAAVTVEDALAHPTWSMGPKITVDSSTLMNKGLEVIEAHELFGVPYDDITVVVHPQSIVHSMVTFADGSTLAQLSRPDMRLAIAYALGHPTRARVAFGRLDWSRPCHLDFEAPDRRAFPCLDLAYAAGRAGGAAPARLNAANEVGVAAFLDGAIPWTGIAEVVAETLEGGDGADLDTAEAVVAADADARRRATRALARAARR